MRSTGRGPSTPSEAGSGVVSSDPGLPQPALTEAAFSELTLSILGQESACGRGVKKIGRPIRNRTAVWPPALKAPGSGL